jgi:Family of unknown function (DUF6194)
VNTETISAYLVATFPNVAATLASEETGAPEVAWGDYFFFYGVDRLHPFATIVTKDYPDFDTASNLNRDGVYRLNIGLSRETYDLLLANESHADPSAFDVLMPHPIYGRNHWVCILNPSDQTFETVKPLLAEAYNRAIQRERTGPA